MISLPAIPQLWVFFKTITYSGDKLLLALTPTQIITWLFSVRFRFFMSKILLILPTFIILCEKDFVYCSLAESILLQWVFECNFVYSTLLYLSYFNYYTKFRSKFRTDGFFSFTRHSSHTHYM